MLELQAAATRTSKVDEARARNRRDTGWTTAPDCRVSSRRTLARRPSVAVGGSEIRSLAPVMSSSCGRGSGRFPLRRGSCPAGAIWMQAAVAIPRGTPRPRRSSGRNRRRRRCKSRRWAERHRRRDPSREIHPAFRDRSLGRGGKLPAPRCRSVRSSRVAPRRPRRSPGHRTGRPDRGSRHSAGRRHGKRRSRCCPCRKRRRRRGRHPRRGETDPSY